MLFYLQFHTFKCALLLPFNFMLVLLIYNACHGTWLWHLLEHFFWLVIFFWAKINFNNHSIYKMTKSSLVMKMLFRTLSMFWSGVWQECKCEQVSFLAAPQWHWRKLCKMLLAVNLSVHLLWLYEYCGLYICLNTVFIQ